MHVSLRVEFDDVSFDITRYGLPHACHHASRICSCSAVKAMGQSVGIMLASLMGGSQLDEVLTRFGEVVARSARSPNGYPPIIERMHPHTTDD